jgi:cell wall-active antibiotic response 4TMS protein YvqF
MSKRKQETLFWGVILILVGVLFLLDSLGIDIDIWDIVGKFWPTILIAIGVKNILVHYQNKESSE